MTGPGRGADAGVPSPCVNVCRMDPATGLCLGCARTLQEIAAWSTLGDAGKRAVWKELPARRERLGPRRVQAGTAPASADGPDDRPGASAGGPPVAGNERRHP